MHKPARQKIELNKWSGARTKRALCAKPWYLNHILKAMIIHLNRVIQSNKHIRKITCTARLRVGRVGVRRNSEQRDQSEEWQQIAEKL